MKKVLLLLLLLVPSISAITLKPGITGGFNDTIKIGPFYDTANHILTSSLALVNADIRLSKNGLKQAAMHGSIAPVYDTNGLWMVYLDSTDVSVIGRLRIDVYKLPAYAFSIMYTVGDTSSIKTNSVVASVTGSVGSVIGGATSATETQIQASITGDSTNNLTNAKATALATLQATSKQDSLQNTTNAKAANLTADSLLIKQLQASLVADSIALSAAIATRQIARAGLDSLSVVRDHLIDSFAVARATAATQSQILANVVTDSNNILLMARAANLAADSLLILQRSKPTDTVPIKLTSHIALCDSVTKLDTVMRPRAGAASTGDTMAIKTTSIIASVTGGATATTQAQILANVVMDSSNIINNTVGITAIKAKTDSLTNLRASYLDTVYKYLNAAITSRSKPTDTIKVIDTILRMPIVIVAADTNIAKIRAKTDAYLDTTVGSRLSKTDSAAIKRNSRIAWVDTSYYIDTVLRMPSITVAADTNVIHMRHKLDSLMFDAYGYVIADMYALNGTLSGGTVTSKRINFQVDTIYGGKVNTDSLIIGKFRTPSSSLDAWGTDGLLLFDTSYVYMKRGVWRRAAQGRW